MFNRKFILVKKYIQNRFSKLFLFIIKFFLKLELFSFLRTYKNMRKSQIFMLDLIFSFVILIAAIGLASIYFSEVTQDENLYELNQDLINRFTTTSINSLNSEEIRQLFSQGEIQNIEYSIAQQVSEYYFVGKDDLARNVTRIFVENFDQEQFFLNVSLIDDVGSSSNLYSSSNLRVSFDNASSSYTLRREVITFLDRSQIIGPYTFEISIWQ